MRGRDRDRRVRAADIAARAMKRFEVAGTAWR
jgi:hypothetical protein